MLLASQIPIGGGNRASAPAGRPGMAPLPAKPERRRSWIFWFLVMPLLLLGLTYVLGRAVEPIRARLAMVPLAGPLLFGDPVWPILWNKHPDGAQTTTAPPAETAGGTTDTASGAQPAPGAPQFSQAEADLAARLAAAEIEENDLRRRENDLQARESAVKAREARLAGQEAALSQELKRAEELRKQLEGQIRSDQGRVEVVRAMKSSAIKQMFDAMTDHEIIRILMYMSADEVAKHLSGMDQYRSARLLQSLRQVAPSTAP